MLSEELTLPRFNPTLIGLTKHCGTRSSPRRIGMKHILETRLVAIHWVLQSVEIEQAARVLGEKAR